MLSDDDWTEESPEDVICEACHIYYDVYDNRYLGMELELGLDKPCMKEILTPFTTQTLKVFEVSL